MTTTSTQKAVTARSQVPRVKWVHSRKTRRAGASSRNRQIARACSRAACVYVGGF